MPTTTTTTTTTTTPSPYTSPYVISFDKSPDTRDGVRDVAVKHKYTVSYIVKVEYPTVDMQEILADVRCPRVGDTYSNTIYDDVGDVLDAYIDNLSACVSVKASPRSDHPWIVDVVAEYDIKPLSEPYEITIDTETFTEAVEQDVITNLGIVNSAGDPFDPPPTRDDSRVILRVTRNEVFYGTGNFIQKVMDWKDSVNSDVWNQTPIGQAYLKSIGGQRLTYGDGNGNYTYYLRVTYTFHIDRNGWKLYILDKGYNYLNAGVRTKIRDLGFDMGGSSAPQLLDGAGGILAVGGAPFFAVFSVYQSKAFADLNLNLG